MKISASAFFALAVAGCAGGHEPLADVDVVASRLGATLEVGPGKTYAKVCDAVGAAMANDTIEIAAGTYAGEACVVAQTGLTLRGVGGRPILDATGFMIPNGKAILDVSGDGVVIDNIEFMGAAVPDNNGAGIRIESPNLTIRRSYFHDNQNGISGGDSGTVLVEYSEFARNGLGPGCAPGNNGCSHNMYIGTIDSFTLRYSYSHELAPDPAGTGRGHLVKSRAKQNFILYNRITGEDGDESYEINFPLGGLAVLVGNEIQKSPNTQNSGSMVFWAEEQLAPGYDNRVFAVNNTFVDGHTGSTALRLGGTGGVLTANNNIFVGVGTTASTGALTADNLTGVDPLFVDPTTYNYRLQVGSPATDKGVVPGMADTFSLVPTFEYVDPTMSVARKSDGKLDLGAFELGTDRSGATSDGGTPAPVVDGGNLGSDIPGGGATASDGGTSDGGEHGSSGGETSGCRVGPVRGGAGAGAPVVALTLAILGALLRRRQREMAVPGTSSSGAVRSGPRRA